MSQIQVDTILDKEGTGAPQLDYGAEVTVGYGITGAGGVNISGFATAGGFVGDLTGDVTGDTSGSSGSCSGNAATATLATNAQGLSGTPDVTVNNVTAGFGTFSGNISAVDATFSGVLTYDDVTNVDSVGIITARSGIELGASGVGGTITGAGSAEFVGIVTVTQGTDLNGYKVEEGSYDSDALNGEFDFELENGHIQTHTGSTAGTFFPDFSVCIAPGA